MLNNANYSFLYLLGNKMDLEVNNNIREVEFDEG